MTAATNPSPQARPVRTGPVRTPQERQAALDATMATLQAGVEALRTTPGWRAWLAFAARMPSYSVSNQLLIVAQCPSATAVAGYAAWTALGRQVRRGETALRILAPVTRPQSPDDSPTPRDGKPDRGQAGDGASRVLAGFRVASVFDVSQTDGAPVPEAPRPPLLEGQAPDGLWEGLARQVAAAGFTLGRVPDADVIGGANGVTDFAARSVLVRSDVPPAHACKTLAHELGHVLLHDPRADPAWAMPCRAVKEVEAESVAYLVAAHAGLDTADYTFGYVAGWASDRTGGDMTAAATRIMAAARTITDQLDPPPEPAPAPSIGVGPSARLAATTPTITTIGAGQARPHLAL